jgi:hypothetical protein
LILRNAQRKVADKDRCWKIFNFSLFSYFLLSINLLLFFLDLFLLRFLLLFLVFFFFSFLLILISIISRNLFLKLVSHKSLLINWKIKDNSSSLISALIELLNCLLAWTIAFEFNKCKTSVAFVVVRIEWKFEVKYLSIGEQQFPQMFLIDVKYQVADN